MGLVLRKFRDFFAVCFVGNCKNLPVLVETVITLYHQENRL